MEQNGLFTDWSNVVSEDRNEIVFETKNKEYGAYQIRKNYNKTILLALAIGVSIVLIFSIFSFIKDTPATEEAPPPPDIAPVMQDAKPMEEIPPPPPPPVEELPKAETTQFTEPEIEEEVETPPPPQEQLTETNVGETTQEGDPDADIITQETNTVVEEVVEEQIFRAVEENPTFPGNFNEFLQKNMNYPPMEYENGIQGTVYVEFVVDRDGKISNVKTVRGVNGGPGLSREAERVIRNSPAWKPAKMNGRPVKAYFTVPVRFVIR